MPPFVGGFVGKLDVVVVVVEERVTEWKKNTWEKLQRREMIRKSDNGKEAERNVFLSREK